jgi:hypothetical protein
MAKSMTTLEARTATAQLQFIFYVPVDFIRNMLCCCTVYPWRHYVVNFSSICKSASRRDLAEQKAAAAAATEASMEADTQLPEEEEEGEEVGELDASPFANLVASMCGGGPPAAQQEPTTERSSLSRSAWQLASLAAWQRGSLACAALIYPFGSGSVLPTAWQLGLCRIHFSFWVRIRPCHSLAAGLVPYSFFFLGPDPSSPQLGSLACDTFIFLSGSGSVLATA